MSHILVVDDKAIFRDLISASLQQAGYKPLCASNGVQALKVVQSSPQPKLILLELNLPQMGGMTFLRTLRRQPLTPKLPVILITEVTNKPTILEAAKLGVSGCILKERFSLTDLLSRIEQIIGPAQKSPPDAVTATSASATCALPSAPVQTSDADATADALAKSLGVPRLLTRDQCIERTEKSLQGKALSGVVAQVIQLAASPLSEMGQVANTIGHDPMLSAKILRVANSAVYTSARGPVTNISDAIKKVGFSTVRNIAATVGVFDSMPTGNKDIFDPLRSWQHSFAVALLCDTLAAGAENPRDAALAYLVGLCHDLGEILFQTCFSNEYRQLLETHARTNHPMPQLEQAMLGVPCSELISVILRSLQLPEAIRVPIETMRANAPCKDRLCSILGLADLYANGMQLASSAKAPVRSFTKAECHHALGPADAPAIDREKIRGEIFALTALLSSGANADITKPLFPRTSSKIWLARESTLSKLDPLEAALDSLGKVQVANRLPNADEIAGTKALVIDAQSPSSRMLSSQNPSTLRAACQNKMPVLWLVQEDETAAQTQPDLPHPLRMPVPLDAVAHLLCA
jgi:HD-like signal output (HDOD) protein/CheY-like chemotaxis protein